MSPPQNLIDLVASASGVNRMETWSQIVREMEARSLLELGVWKGEFAAHLLRRCPEIARYYMLDSWRRLDSWNKPANVGQDEFDAIQALAMQATDFARERRIVLRGKTTEVIEQIPDGALDIAYIDADHTLRGIAIDLMRVYPKVRPGGLIGGDDYTRSIWQHDDRFEPTLVCPFAAYFAEAQGAPIVILPHNQFAIVKPSGRDGQFRLIDTTGKYGPTSLLPQMAKRS